MNQKGQGEVAFVVILLFVIAFIGYSFYPVINKISSQENIAANNFCQAWANEQEFQHLKGYYKYFLNSPPEILCQYSTETQTFDGGTSREETKYKQFKITKENLLQWTCKT